jgi:hypothetical protein
MTVAVAAAEAHIYGGNVDLVSYLATALTVAVTKALVTSCQLFKVDLGVIHKNLASSKFLQPSKYYSKITPFSFIALPFFFFFFSISLKVASY